MAEVACKEGKIVSGCKKAIANGSLRPFVSLGMILLSQFASGYYSVLFEDPDGIRVEVNHVPGQGHLGSGGRLGPDGEGPANDYGSQGLKNI